MTPRRRRVAWLVLAGMLVSSEVAAQQPERTPIRPDPISESDIAYRYRLFETTNIWTFILLDTGTGRAWQIQYSLDETPTARLVINDASLLPDGAKPKNGRFTLYRTHNIYNFLLLDREDSRIWQIQWSSEAKDRGIVRSIPARK